MTEIVRVRCPHRIGLCYRDGDLLRLLPCDCNDPSEVLEVVTALDTPREDQPTPEPRCCPGAGSMAHTRGCRNHPEAGR